MAYGSKLSHRHPKIKARGRIAAMMNAKPVKPIRARFVLVVSDLKPDPRAGDVARCWLQI